MKTLLKNTIAAAVLAGATPAMAAVVNVGGVTWDTDSPFDFTATSGNVAQEFATEAASDITTLSGYGRIDFIHWDADFCPGCELTFEYGGYTSEPGFDPVNPGMADFMDGWVNVYVDSNTNFDINNRSTAMEGELWLALTGVTLDGGTLTVTTNDQGANGKGLLAVEGGLAAEYFDTNTYANNADVEFQTSFTAGSGFTRGSGNIASDTAAVPEPGTIGLLGLGLLATAVARRHRA